MPDQLVNESAVPQSNALLFLSESSPFAAFLACGSLYYVAAEAGIAFRFTDEPSAAVSPSSALLTAMLLLLPARRWWIALLSIVPAHCAAHASELLPMWRLVWQVAYIWTLAAAIAFALRQTIDARRPLGTVRNLVLYIGITASVCAAIAVLAPRTVLTWLELAGPQQQTLGLAWRSVYLATFVTILTMTPALFLWASHGPRWLRHASASRCLELALIAAVICAAYASASVNSQSHAPLYLLAVAALWAAARFAVAGAASAMFVIATLLVSPDQVPHSLLVRQAPAAEVLDLQIFLIGISLSVFILAILVEERDRSAESLRRSEERFQLVVRATNDAIFDWDIVGGNWWWSVKGTEHTHPADRSCSSTYEWVERIHEEDRARYLRELDATLSGTQNAWDIEYRLWREDGSIMHAHERASMLRLANNAPSRMIGSRIDVTDRKRREEADRALARAARLTSLGEITACIAHQINQPLGAILNNAEAALLLLKSGSLEASELEQILLDVRSDVLRASAVIRRLRALLQDRRLERRPLDLNEIAQDIAHLVRADANRRSIVLHLHCEPIPLIEGDGTHLQQVLLNLVLNSMDALLGVPEPQRYIRVHTEVREDDAVQVRVVDGGCGILPEHLPKVFDSFYTTKDNGLGLGLSIARTIVTSHGGRIWAENNEDASGATFRFELPALPQGRRVQGLACCDESARIEHWHHDLHDTLAKELPGGVDVRSGSRSSPPLN